MRDGTVEVWRSELDLAGAVVEDPTVARVLANPAVALESRDAMVDFGHRPDRLAVRSSTSSSSCSGAAGSISCRASRRSSAASTTPARASSPATATTAAPLSQDEVRALVGRLEQMTGGRIELDLQVDPSLLGGLVVRVGDRLIDGSVRGRLERLRNQLVSGAL